MSECTPFHLRLPYLSVNLPSYGSKPAMVGYATHHGMDGTLIGEMITVRYALLTRTLRVSKISTLTFFEIQRDREVAGDVDDDITYLYDCRISVWYGSFSFL
eukprot:scaffold2460_cov178-Amphora_coffeaeformis.AAC.3